MYKREISILCSFLFPTLLSWAGALKMIVCDGEVVRDALSLMVEGLNTRVSGYP